MAGKGGFLGNLYYTITGEDRLEEILRKDKELAQEVAKIAGGIKIGGTRITQDAAKNILKEAEALEKAGKAADGFAAAQEKIRSKQATGEFKEYIQSLTSYSDAQKQMSAYYRELEKEMGTAQTAAGSIKMLEAELKKLKDTYRSLSETDRNSILGKTMLTQINNADENLAKINAEMANNAALAKTMGTQYNGLRTQISMVARELPNLGISLSTFIISLSNNLPYLADEISKASKEFDKLKASGQTATTVWKQMIGAIFNWQTALIVGVTVLTAYSREIQAWVQGMFVSKKAIDSNIESLEEFQKKVAESNSGVMATFESLRQKWNSLGDSLEEKNKFIRDSQDEFGKLGVSITNVDEATSVFNSNTDDFLQALDGRAKAAAAMDLAAEEYKKAISKMMEADQEQITFWDRMRFNQGIAGPGMPNLENTVSPENIVKKRKENIEKDAQELFKIAAEYVKKYGLYSKEVEDILTKINVKTSDAITEGSVGAIEASIALKRKALKDITNPEDYKKIKTDIDKLEKQLESITGGKTVNINYNKLRQDVLSVSKALEDAARESERNIEQTRINLMEEGGEKQLAQLKLNFRKRMDEVKAQTDEYIKLVRDQELKEWKEKNPTKKDSEFKSSTVDFNTLPKEYQNLIVKQAQLANEEYEKNTQDLVNNLLKKWGDYGDKRAALEADTAEKIKRVNSERDLIGNDTADKVIKMLKKQLQAGIDALESESLKLTPFYQQLFGDIGNYGNLMLRSLMEQTRDIIRQAQQIGKNSKGVYTITVDSEKVELTEADIARLQKQLGLMDKQLASNNPFLKLKNAIRDYRYASSDAAKDDAFKKELESISEIASGVSQSLSALQDTLGDIGVDSPELDAIFGGLEKTLNGLSSIDITKPFSVITGGLTAIGGLFQTIFNPKQARLQRVIENSQREVKRLQNAFEDLDRAVDKALGEEVYTVSKKQLQNLRQQQAELSKQIQAERDKKKTDQDFIDDANRQIEELNQEIIDIVESIRENILGGTVQDIVNKLGDAFFDAFAKGEDAAEAWGDKVDQIAQGVIRRMLIQKLVEEPVGKILEKYTSKWMDSQGNFLGYDQIMQSAADLGVELKDFGVGLSSIIDTLPDNIKDILQTGDETKKKGLSGAIQGVTEDTANVIGSYLNAIRADVSVNRVNLQKLTDGVISPLNEMALAVANLKHLETIAGNTGRNADAADRILDILEGARTNKERGLWIK